MMKQSLTLALTWSATTDTRSARSRPQKRAWVPVSAHENDEGETGMTAEDTRMTGNGRNGPESLQSPTRKLHVFTSGGVF